MTDTELAFIGCCALDPKRALESLLEAKHFQDIKASVIYLKIRSNPDDMTVFDQDERSLLVTAMQDAPVPSLALTYEERILKSWQRREMDKLALEIRVAVTDQDPLEDIESHISSRLIEIDAVAAKEATHEETIERLSKDILEAKPSDFLSGLPKFDEAAGGYNRGELIVVYGDTSHGKSSTIYSLILAPLLSGARVCVLDYEMGKDLSYKRLAVLISEVSLQEVVSRRLSETELPKYQEALHLLKRCALLVLNDPIAIGLQKAQAFGADIVVVDYIQLAADAEKTKNENLSQTITSIMRRLKNFSIAKKCAIFVGSQVVKDYGAGRPHLADIKESGAIANSADKVICSYWGSKRGNVSDETIYLLGLDKNKNGKTVDLIMQIKPWCAKICEPTVSFSPADIQEIVK